MVDSRMFNVTDHNGNMVADEVILDFITKFLSLYSCFNPL